MPAIKEQQGITSDQFENIKENRTHFSTYNMVRMRETLRYLTPEKLKLFIEIPFFIHMNTPDLPVYVDTAENISGIWNFETSGFLNEAARMRQISLNNAQKPLPGEPSILGLYHIGSLGTFTQSVGSDFDFWVIIDKRNWPTRRYQGLKEKLDRIVAYSREEFDQEVTFFIMDQEAVKENRFTRDEADGVLTVPGIFLKEEFYRTFLMIAGKIPFWAISPVGMDTQSYDRLFLSVFGTNDLAGFSRDMIDLGNITPATDHDIIKGLMWHIHKSRIDPVKALVKASMIFSYRFGRAEDQTLICEVVKSGYRHAGIDDYSVDPYKVLFDRIIRYHEAFDRKGLNLIKTAVFFRLCGFPAVGFPEKNSPKWQLLTRYIRSWNLKPERIQKLLNYKNWSEHEKLVLEQALLNRLSIMLSRANKEIKGSSMTKGEEGDAHQNWTILKHMVRARLNTDTDKIQSCSLFLKRKKFDGFVCRKMPESSEWLLFPRETGRVMDTSVYRSHYFLELFGWLMENQLYDSSAGSIDLESAEKLFETGSKPVDLNRMYIYFMPLRPMTDSVFEAVPVWTKIMLLLVYDCSTSLNLLEKVEILAANTWGELYLSHIDVSRAGNEEAKCKEIVHHLKRYDQTGARLSVFQFSMEHDPDIVYKIKTTMNLKNLKLGSDARGLPSKRPYLDLL